MTQVPSVHVQESSDEAIAVLQSLHNERLDDVISKAFPQFVASMGEDDPRLLHAYLSEINLAMRDAPFDPDRVKRAIAFIEVVRPDNRKGHPLLGRVLAGSARDNRAREERNLCLAWAKMHGQPVPIGLIQFV